jgi:spectinomycin phosphotransferase
MLTPPNIPISFIIERLAAEFGVQAERLEFLPLGADTSTAVFRAEAGAQVYFLKLRRGAFNPITVKLPAYLHAHGLHALIPPLPTRAAQAWEQLEPADLPDQAYTMILYPFIAGENAYQQRPTPAQWQAFGTALAHLHAVRLPPHLGAQLPVETFPALQRDATRAALAAAEATTYRDPVAAQLKDDLRGWRQTITTMLDRTDALADALRARPPAFVVCHSDIHAGNLHLTPGGELYLVDWDAPLYAPKERDLLLIGGCSTWNDPQETALFYAGYGQPVLHPQTLVYYRYQRVIEDIAAYCQQLLESDEGGADRPRSLRHLRSNLTPGGEIELAVETDRLLLI